MSPDSAPSSSSYHSTLLPRGPASPWPTPTTCSTVLSSGASRARGGAGAAASRSAGSATWAKVARRHGSPSKVTTSLWPNTLRPCRKMEVIVRGKSCMVDSISGDTSRPDRSYDPERYRRRGRTASSARLQLSSSAVRLPARMRSPPLERSMTDEPPQPPGAQPADHGADLPPGPSDDDLAIEALADDIAAEEA